MKNHAAYLCGRMNCELLSAETDGDHMHLLVSMAPDVAPVKLINSLKSNLSKEVHIYYREHIQKYLWGDSPFWSASYFCATTGSVSMETVKKYIEERRTDEQKGNIQNPENTKSEKTKRFIPNLTEGVFSPKYYEINGFLKAFNPALHRRSSFTARSIYQTRRRASRFFVRSFTGTAFAHSCQ